MMKRHLLASALALAIIAVAGFHPASALTTTGSGGVNATNGTRFVDPDAHSDAFANGGGAQGDTTWGDRLMKAPEAEQGAPNPQTPARAHWPEHLFEPTFIIGGAWHYPPSRP